MKTRRLQRQTYLRQPLAEVFRFFSSPENLERITPPELGFRILTPRPIRMAKGAKIDYTICLSGIKVRWTTLITAYDPPYSFVDEQIKGPYRYWRHEHLFSAVPDGTRVTDRVDYAALPGFLGDIADKVYVAGNLKKIFDYREKAIRAILAPQTAGAV